MNFCCAIFLDTSYFRSYDLIAKPNGTYVTAVDDTNYYSYGHAKIGSGENWTGRNTPN